VGPVMINPEDYQLILESLSMEADDDFIGLEQRPLRRELE
jgi:hypothetical protein